MSGGQELEKKAVSVMISFYCRKNHHTKSLCEECSKLLDYSYARIEHCIFKDDKPNCSKCTVHCYKKDMREQIKEVMRYSGPRRLWYNPLFALGHFLRNLSKPKDKSFYLKNSQNNK